MQKNKSLQVKVFACRNALADSLATEGLREVAEVGGMEVEQIPCLGRIDPRYLLKAFEAGYDGVCLIGCPVGKCKTMDGNLRAQKRVFYAGRVLNEIGIKKQRLFLFLREPMNEEGIRKVMEEFLAAVRDLKPTGLRRPKVAEETRA